MARNKKKTNKQRKQATQAASATEVTEEVAPHVAENKIEEDTSPEMTSVETPMDGPSDSPPRSPPIAPPVESDNEAVDEPEPEQEEAVPEPEAQPPTNAEPVPEPAVEPSDASPSPTPSDRDYIADQLISARADVSRLEAEVKVLQTDVTAATEARETAVHAEGELRAEMGALQVAFDLKTHECDAAEAKAAAQTAECANLLAQVDGLLQQSEEGAELHGGLLGKLESTEASNTKLRTEVEELRQALTATRAELRQAVDDRDSMTVEISTLMDDVEAGETSHTAEMAALEAKLNSKTARIDAGKDELEAARRIIQEQEQEVLTLQEAASQAEQLTTTVADGEGRVAGLLATIEEMKREIEARDAEIETLQAKLDGQAKVLADAVETRAADVEGLITDNTQAMDTLQTVTTKLEAVMVEMDLKEREATAMADRLAQTEDALRQAETVAQESAAGAGEEGRRVAELQEALAMETARVQAIEEEAAKVRQMALDEYMTRSAALESQVETLRGELEAKEKEANDAALQTDQLAELRTKVVDTARLLGLAQSTVSGLKDRLAAAEKDKSELELKVEEGATAISDAQEAARLAEEARAALEVQLEEALEEASRDPQRLDDDLQAAAGQLRASEELVEMLREEIAANEADIDVLDAKIAELEAYAVRVTKDNEDAAEQLQTLQAAAEHEADRASEARNLAATYEKALVEERRMMQEAARELNAADAMISQLKTAKREDGAARASDKLNKVRYECEKKVKVAQTKAETRIRRLEQELDRVAVDAKHKADQNAELKAEVRHLKRSRPLTASRLSPAASPFSAKLSTRSATSRLMSATPGSVSSRGRPERTNRTPVGMGK